MSRKKNKIEIVNEIETIIRIEDESSFQEYEKTFIQRIPRYTIKLKDGWKTRKKALTDALIKLHLSRKYIIGVLAKWYPDHFLVDLDDVTKERVKEIRSKLGLDCKNSMLCSSESANSYHLLGKPAYKNKPPTVRLLQDTFKQFVKQNDIEIYPQANRTARLPFGYNQECLDPEYIQLKNWEDKLYWFKRLIEFDLAVVPNQQERLNLKFKGIEDIKSIEVVKDPRIIKAIDPNTPNTPKIFNTSSVFEEGKNLLRYGLQTSNSRHDAQFKVSYYLWRINVPIEETKKIIWNWIRKKHNGFSKDIKKYPESVRKEINRQVERIYMYYEYSSVYPDSTHQDFYGFICKPDLEDIIRICKANAPRMKFLFHLIKYYYPRRLRDSVSIHSDKFIEWSSRRSYKQFLEELIKVEIILRGKSYLVEQFSKNIEINWNFRNRDNAILSDNRSPDSFENTLKLSYKPEELRGLLKKAGSEKSTTSEMIKRIYG
ncbi:hypothetical protein ES705_43440 [subsurface metagenome]